MKNQIIPFINHINPFNLNLASEKLLVKDITEYLNTDECFYVYQVVEKDRISTGLLAAVLADKEIKTHENILSDKIQRYTNMLLNNSIQNFPIMLFYPQQDAINNILSNEISRKPDQSKKIGLVEHKVWRIQSNNTNSHLVELFELVDKLYVADGHHRLATTQNIYHQQSAQFFDEQDEKCNISILAALFPHTQINILPYNRGCNELNGYSSVQFLKQLKRFFYVVQSDIAVTPQENIELGMILADKWYCLKLKDIPSKSPNYDQLSGIELLESIIFTIILNIQEDEYNQRIVFIEGNKTAEEFKSYISSNQLAVGFTFKTINVQELMDIADAGKRLPPHSTWFVPRLTNNLVFHDSSTHEYLNNNPSVKESAASDLFFKRDKPLTIHHKKVLRNNKVKIN